MLTLLLLFVNTDNIQHLYSTYSGYGGQWVAILYFLVSFEIDILKTVAVRTL